MNLEEYFENGIIRKITPDISLVESLIKMSDLKEKVVKNSNIDSENVSVFVSVSYDSFRQVLEAICIFNGYKVLSHVCVGKLLKFIIDDFDYIDFDRIRWVRNDINYYGKRIGLKDGKNIISKIFKMKKLLIGKHLNM